MPKETLGVIDERLQYYKERFWNKVHDFETLYEAAREEAARTARKRTSGGRQRQSVAEAMLKSAARSVGSSLGRRLVRGLLGSLLK